MKTSNKSIYTVDDFLRQIWKKLIQIVIDLTKGSLSERTINLLLILISLVVLQIGISSVSSLIIYLIYGVVILLLISLFVDIYKKIKPSEKEFLKGIDSGKLTQKEINDKLIGSKLEPCKLEKIFYKLKGKKMINAQTLSIFVKKELSSSLITEIANNHSLYESDLLNFIKKQKDRLQINDLKSIIKKNKLSKRVCKYLIFFQKTVHTVNIKSLRIMDRKNEIFLENNRNKSLRNNFFKSLFLYDTKISLIISAIMLYLTVYNNFFLLYQYHSIIEYFNTTFPNAVATNNIFYYNVISIIYYFIYVGYFFFFSWIFLTMIIMIPIKIIYEVYLRL